MKHIQTDLALATHARKGAEIKKNQQKTGTVDTLAQTLIKELVEKGKGMFNEKDSSGAWVYSNPRIHTMLEGHRDSHLKEGVWLNSLLSDDSKY